MISDFVSQGRHTSDFTVVPGSRLPQELLQSAVRVENHLSSVLDTFLLLP